MKSENISKTSIYTVEKLFKKRIDTINSLQNLSNITAKISSEIINVLNNNNKVLICGNGGSAADSQHIAGELINKFNFDRESLPAIALTTDTSVITSIGNDSDFKYIFSKQVSALGKKGDVLIAISTSGNSPNIIEAVKIAKEKGIFVIGFCGLKGGKLGEISDLVFNAPSDNTPLIQECHIIAFHIICHIIEEEIFNNN